MTEPVTYPGVSSRRSLCVVTGTRAEYGLLYWLLREIQADPALELQLVATGAHLSPEFGLTYRQIEADGFSLAAKVEMLLSSDTRLGTAKSLGLATLGFAETLERLTPDLVVVLGDRYEILAVAQAALALGLPLAHLHGGETTEGAIDESIRHAVTKLAHLHFVAAPAYRRRVIQLGEAPDRVFDVGAPGLDHLTRLEPMSREALSASLGFDLGESFFLVSYHPVTLGGEGPDGPMRELTAALDAFPEAKVLFTMPNADAGGRAIRRCIEAYAASQPDRVLAVESLGQARYWSAMRLALAVVGNSSSGLIEAPAIPRPTVNVGDRQRGRLRAASVVDVGEDRAAIEAGLRLALSPAFEPRLAAPSPYGMGGASARIKAILKTADLSNILRKPFHDLPIEGKEGP